MSKKKDKKKKSKKKEQEGFRKLKFDVEDFFITDVLGYYLDIHPVSEEDEKSFYNN